MTIKEDTLDIQVCKCGCLKNEHFRYGFSERLECSRCPCLNFEPKEVEE
jgi:hypothetical protein